MTTTAKEKKQPVKITIKCVDCGAPREVNKSEEFQVKRCEGCQLLHRKVLRRGYRKNRIANLRLRIQKLEELLTENNVAIPA